MPRAPFTTTLQHLRISCLSAHCRPACLRRYAGVTGWSSILRTLLVHQEHWQSLGLLNFLQLASTSAAGPGEWEEDEGLEVQGQEWEEEEGEEEEEYDGEDCVAGGMGYRRRQLAL